MKLIDRLVQDVFEDDYFNHLFKQSALLSADYVLDQQKATKLSTKEFLDSLRFADVLSNSNDPRARNKAYQLVTYLNTEYSQTPEYKTVSKAVYSKLGNFPAISYLESDDDNQAQLPFQRAIEMESKKIIQAVPDTDGLVFTDSQFELFSRLSNTLEFSFSGPTSMGKSFMIKAFIKKVMRNSPPENLVILVPTRALINQFSIDLRSELTDLMEKYKYRILTNSSVSDLTSDEPHNYILVLTPERLISYLSQPGNPPIGFIFVDEAHKLANEKDSRSITAYTSLEKALKRYGNIKLYFSSPNVSNPEVFLELFGRGAAKNSFRTDESPVSQNLFFIDLIEASAELYIDKEPIAVPMNGFFNEVNSAIDVVKMVGKGKNNLVYCNAKARTIERAREFTENRERSATSSAIRKAIKQIQDYIHPDYFLAELLRFQTAFHHGKLPQLIRNLVEELYKNEEVKTVFCTSTLLEGVNMPTKNIFILDNRNGLNKLEPIDFWNLSGRAGRLAKELAGNIFCIQHEDCEWTDKGVLKKEPINLKPTVLTKIDRNLRKIEKVLKEQDISGSKEEQFILKYLANIISVDTLEIDSNYKSPLITKLIEKNKDQIIELARQATEGFEIPEYILGLNQSINLKVQNNVYTETRRRFDRGTNVKLPSSSEIDYERCKSVLLGMYRLYAWDKAEKKLNNQNSMNYYAMLMNKWIHGLPLNMIISQSLDYYRDSGQNVQVSFNEYVPFEKGNKEHINIVIEKVIEDIEYILRFLFEKYFNHYYQILIQLYGEDDAGENWASLLEYGTQNRIVIALQNLGLSRNTALKIYQSKREALTIVDGKLERVDRSQLISAFNNDSLEFGEVMRVL